MKMTIFSLLMVFGSWASAVQIEEARFVPEKQAIEMDVIYKGGCEEHTFRLEVQSCNRSMPMTCVAKLIDEQTQDACRGIIKTTIQMPAQNFYNDQILDGLIILGDYDTAANVVFE